MRDETVRSDLTVVGGGLAGVCAAIAAARLGRRVALVQNRPVLGGNSSSEVRVWVCGATAHGVNRYARETGIMGELFVENQFRNPDGNPYYWDLVVLDAVRAEPNITLFLNTDVHELEAHGPEEERRITAVSGWMMGSERRIRFEGPVFLDCTGDGLIGFLAGARHRVGREARAEYGEPWAPEVADNVTLGSTLLFYTKDAGRPVKFVPPSFARDITQTSIPERRIIRAGDNGCAYWWIEWGGELDTVHQNERIRDELWAVIYGIWDHIKNSGKFQAETMTLEWVGSLPGKREYRRLLGDYVLTQHDILGQTPFADRVAFGGWSIDLHPPQGMYAAESGSKHLFADGVYHIPFRSLYSANVANLLMAGRDISASHVAFGTTRVMATCATIGEAAGTAAALCVARGVTPRELARDHLDELQQTLLRQDASLVGLPARDPTDLARVARVRASSTLRRLAAEMPAGRHRLDADLGLLLPVNPRLECVELLLDAEAPTTLEVGLWDTGRPENYVPHALVARRAVPVAAGEAQWVAVELPWSPAAPQNAFVVVRANPLVQLVLTDGPLTGALAFARSGGGPDRRLEEREAGQPIVEWRLKPLARRLPCFRVAPDTAAYGAEHLIDGYQRPYGGPHLWLSEPLAPGSEAWVELAWPEPMTVAEVQLIFNDDVNEDLVNLHHHRTPFEVFPELARDYRLEACVGGRWVQLARAEANRRRRRVHRLEAPVPASALRLTVEATNGGRHAEVVAVRVYGEPPTPGLDPR